MRKKILIILLVGFILTSGIIASAYFYKKLTGATHNITANLDQTSIIEINSFEEFVKEAYLYSSTSSEYNYDSEISNIRKTLKLTTNITFRNDVLVNKDCHINLNGKTIDLNGYDLNVKNQFAGRFEIYNGTIIDSSTPAEGESYGQLIIDCPNAVYEFNDLSYDEQIISILNVSEEQVCLAAFEFIYANIANTGINGFYDSKYIEGSSFNCEFCDNTEQKYCIYTYKDLDLINNYFSYGVNISYTSGNEALLTSVGRVISNETSTLVPLTIKVAYNNQSVEKIINVHVVEETDYAKAAASVLFQYLENYYVDGKYKFETALVLPLTNNYFNCSYEYILSNGVTSATSNEYFDKETISGCAVTIINSDIDTLQIKATASNSSYTSEAVGVIGEASSNIDDNYSYALEVLSSLYGNQIEIRNGQATQSTYTEIQLLTDPSVYNYSRLTSISYSLVNNYENTYQIVDYSSNFIQYDLLNVPTNVDVPPYLGQTVFLVVTFTFVKKEGALEADVIDIQLPIVYKSQAVESSSGFDGFSPYYAYFNNEFIKETNNYSIESFSIPLEYENSYPVYELQVYQINDDLTYTPINTDSGLFTISLSGSNTISLFEKGARTNITINPYYISKETISYYFVYIPVYKDGQGNILYWGKNSNGNYYKSNLSGITIENIDEYEYKSLLTIPGIVRYQKDGSSVIEEEFTDLDLYTLAYELLYKEDYTDQFIYTSALSRKIDSIDFSSDNGVHTVNLSATETLGQINSLKGINLLTGILDLTFEGTSLLTGNDLNITEIEYISQITNLEVLNLSSTSIYDSKQANTGFAEGDSNQILIILSSLTNLKKLFLANNKIFSFADLSLFASLEYVDVTNNTFECTLLNTGIDALDNYVNNALTTATNAINGSNGATNINVFKSLEAKGVRVEGYSESAEADDKTQAIINALISLEYQDKLNGALPISTIYEQFSKNHATYGLPTPYSTTQGDITISFTFKEIRFESVDEQDSNGNYTGTYFTFVIVYTYSCKNSILTGGDVSGDINYTQNYRITRY